MKRVPSALGFALAMACVESAVVVYLRVLAEGGPFIGTALPRLPPNVARIEVAREAATIVMLVAAAALGGRTRWERVLLFWLMFAVWDLAYYGWLWVLVGWPPSLLTWDVLFLIPVPWTAPVLAPVIVSAALAITSLRLLAMHACRIEAAYSRWTLVGVVLGGLVAFTAFVVDYRVVQAGREPATFHWEIFISGVVIAAVALVRGAWRGVPIGSKADV